MLTSQLSPEKVSTILLVADMTCSQQLKQSALKYCVLYKEYIYKVTTEFFHLVKRLSMNRILQS